MPDDFLHSATLAGRARDGRVPSFTEVTCWWGGLQEDDEMGGASRTM